MGLKQPVQIVSIETLRRRIDKIPDSYMPDLLIVDEAHVGMDRTKEMQAALGNPLSLLLTATPSLLSGRGLGEISDIIVETCGTQELIDEGLLVPIRYFAPSVVDLSGVKQRMGDYAQNELEKVMDKPSITGDAAATYKKRGHGRPALFYCVSLDHCEHASAEFRAHGYRTLVVSGNSTDAERQAAIRALTYGDVDAVFNCQLWIAGVDCPAISYIGWLCPTQSLTKFLQGCGRGLRPLFEPGYDLSTVDGRIEAIRNSVKPDLIISDHANNWQIHGFPTDDREWSLDGERRRKRKSDPDDIPIKTCPDCFRVLRSSASVCECGHVFTPRGREIEVVEGELAEIDVVALRRERMREQGRAQTLEDLLELAARTGKKPGWAHHVYRARQEKLNRSVAKI